MPSFSKGEIIFQDKPYATSVLEERLGDTCNWCFAHPILDSIRCSVCSATVYCSQKCREKDKEYHSLECIFLASDVADVGDGGMRRFILRTLVRVLAEKESNSPKVGLFFDRPCTFQDLLSHVDLMDEEQLGYFRGTSDELSKFISEQGQEVSKDLIFEISLKLYVNGHCAKDYSTLNSEHLGHALYLAGSKTNHSCVFQDDFIQLFEGNRTVLKALRDFTVSDPLELKTQYIPLQYSYALRQELLQKRYFFKCECARCVEECSQPRPPFLEQIEHFLLQPATDETLDLLESFQARFARFPNTNHYKNMLLTRLFLEGKRQSAGTSLSLATGALEGCRLITDRMKILYILCSDLASFGANDPSHEFNDKFKHFHAITLSLFTDVHGPGHRLVKRIADMAAEKLEEQKTVSPKVNKSTPVVLDAV